MAVINSRIDGDFEGWEGESRFLLENGQTWMQIGWDFMDGHAHRPRVLIQNGIMSVEGFAKTIRVMQVEAY